LLSRLGSGTLVVLCALLFVVDLVIPDPVPFVDELLLGAATLLLSRWRQRAVSERAVSD
jgi:hypothetical protein